MSQLIGLITVDEMVMQYLDEAEAGIHKYYKCFQLAIRAMDELGIDAYWQVKTVQLVANANKTMSLPHDFRTYVKIGVLSGGQLFTIKANDKLSNFGGTSANRAALVGGTNVYANYLANAAFTNLNSFGWLAAGGFTIDVSNDVIILDTNFQYTTLVLEYIASPSEEEANYAPVQFREAIISYIRWKDLISMPSTRKGNGSDKRERERIYYNERRLAKSRYTPFILDEAHKWITETTYLGIKA